MAPKASEGEDFLTGVLVSAPSVSRADTSPWRGRIEKVENKKAAPEGTALLSGYPAIRT